MLPGGESTTGTFVADSVAAVPPGPIWSAEFVTWTVQNRPDGATPPLKSWTCDPEPGSYRSIHMNANVPNRVMPSWATYLPWNTRMSVDSRYALPRLSVAVPEM